MSDHTVLMVEDDTMLATVVQRHLSARGFDVVVAGSTEDAISRLGDLRPALILLDINLPGETGWELARNPAVAAAGSPPIIVASATRISPSRLREHGIAGYLPKPFPLDTLIQIVERTVGGTDSTDG